MDSAEPDNAFEALRKGMENANGRQSPSQSISRMRGNSLSIQSLKLDDNITAKGTKNMKAERSPLPAMKMFTQKIANCAEEFGHQSGGTPDDDIKEESDGQINEELSERDNYA